VLLKTVLLKPVPLPPEPRWLLAAWGQRPCPGDPARWPPRRQPAQKDRRIGLRIGPGSRH